jgi:hypothetical protein
MFAMTPHTTSLRDAKCRYTAKLQRMFTDMTLSTSLNTRFYQTELGSNIPFNLKMLVRYQAY